MEPVFNLDALKAFYKDYFPRDIYSPGIKKLLSKPETIEEAERLMLEKFAQREERVNNEYNETFYGIKPVK